MGSLPGWTAQAWPVSPDVRASQTASATSIGRQQREARLVDRRPGVAAEHRRVGNPGADRVDRDPACGEGRSGTADEADDRVLRGGVDRIVRHRGEPGQRCRGDDPAAFRHHLRKAPDPEDDAVDVHRHGPSIALERDLGRVRPRTEHAGVETGDIDRSHGVPLVGVGDVEAGREVEHLHREALAAEPGDHCGAEPRGSAGDDRSHGTSTTFPVECRLSTNRCASATSASGNVAPTIGRTWPAAQSPRRSCAASRTTPGSRCISLPR